MAKFMYLFRTNPGLYRSLSPEQMQQTAQKWIDWKDSLARSGNLANVGERLDGSGKVVRGTAKAVTDGPFVEVKDAVQGYIVVEARDVDHAVELAGGCPVLDHDGSVEIRRFYVG
jgi:hypothetical protein